MAYAGYRVAYSVGRTGLAGWYMRMSTENISCINTPRQEIWPPNLLIRSIIDPAFMFFLHTEIFLHNLEFFWTDFGQISKT